MFQYPGNSIGAPLLSAAGLGILPISCAEPRFWSVNGWRGDVKRVCDIVFALLGLVVLSIPMLLIALVIRIESRGPALFHQRRIGFANVGFEMWKFRTMHRHASEPGRLRQATRHDKRVTRVGAVLRRCSLDELPQLFNVLRGDMSLIGPRPHASGTYAGSKPFEMVTPHYAARHCVRPGLTGLAQVRGWRGETETETKLLHRIESDLEYIDNWSLRLDLVILACTVAPVLARTNAF
jgi:lipopolysaccharide/colanic/teichoic acid biosynthesis glycosyltransferase